MCELGLWVLHAGWVVSGLRWGGGVHDLETGFCDALFADLHAPTDGSAWPGVHGRGGNTPTRDSIC